MDERSDDIFDEMLGLLGELLDEIGDEILSIVYELFDELLYDSAGLLDKILCEILGICISYCKLFWMRSWASCMSFWKV